MKSIPIPLTLIDEIKKNKIRQYIGKLIFKKGEKDLTATCFFIKLEKVFNTKNENIFQDMNALMTNYHVIDCYQKILNQKVNRNKWKGKID